MPSVLSFISWVLLAIGLAGLGNIRVQAEERLLPRLTLVDSCVAEKLTESVRGVLIQNESALLTELRKTSGPLAIIMPELFHYETQTRVLVTRPDGSQRVIEFSEGDSDGAWQVVPHLLVARSDREGRYPPTSWYSDAHPNIAIHLTSDRVAEADALAKSLLFSEYKTQPARRSGIEKYGIQDARNRGYTTHFIQLVGDREWLASAIGRKAPSNLKAIITSHIQVQVSDDPAIPTNTEDLYRPYRPEEGRLPGKRWGDFQRGLKPNDEALTEHQQTDLDHRLPREVRFGLGFQRALSWFLHSANGDYGSFDVTQEVYDKVIVPLLGAENVSHVDIFPVEGTPIPRLAIVMNREQMIRAEARLLRRFLVNRFEAALSSIQIKGQIKGQVTGRGTRAVTQIDFQALPFERDVYRDVLAVPAAMLMPDERSARGMLSLYLQSGSLRITDSSDGSSMLVRLIAVLKAELKHPAE